MFDDDYLRSGNLTLVDRRRGQKAGHGDVAIGRIDMQLVADHVQEQAELVGFLAVAGGLVGAGVELYVLDQVLHFSPGAVDPFVEVLVRS